MFTKPWETRVAPGPSTSMTTSPTPVSLVTVYFTRAGRSKATGAYEQYLC